MKALRGFTFIELVITVAIIGILASAVLPLAELAVKRAKEHDLRDALRQIRTAIDEYKKAVEEGRLPPKKVDETGYPPRLEVLAEGVVDPKDPAGRRKIYFLRRVPRDPFHTDGSVSASETWGKRSYASSAEDPQPGADVYDVYSLSDVTSINGVPYRQW